MKASNWLKGNASFQCIKKTDFRENNWKTSKVKTLNYKELIKQECPE